MTNHPTRRQTLKQIAAFGAAGAATSLVPAWAVSANDPKAPKAPRALKVGLVYIGPRNDWGWNQSHAVAGEALKRDAGVTIIEAPYLPESTDYGSGKLDAETRAYAAAIEGLVAGGAKLVISTSFDEDPFLLAAARKHPGVLFRQASLLAHKEYPSNLGSQNGLIHQGHYVNGVAAGLCTRTSKLGFVAGKPFGAVLLNINAFTLGVRHSNPGAKVHVVFTGQWEDEAHDTAAANTLVDAGCDVVTCHLDAPQSVIATAEKRGVKTCGHAFNQAGLAPRGYITGAEHHWDGLFAGFVATLRKPSPLPNFVTGGYDKGLVRSSPFGAGANPKAIAAATSAMEAMRQGKPIFVGPIRDNAGKVVIPSGKTLDHYAAELQQTSYLIEGVVGSLK